MNRGSGFVRITALFMAEGGDSMLVFDGGLFVGEVWLVARGLVYRHGYL
ncbi:hypothetical protein [Bartonella massiliensis]|nr:hypothetical protein [Bartonella massiliensis]